MVLKTLISLKTLSFFSHEYHSVSDDVILVGLKSTVCSPLKNYFNFLTHDFNTRNSKTTIALPKVELDFAFFNSLPLKNQAN